METADESFIFLVVLLDSYRVFDEHSILELSFIGWKTVRLLRWGAREFV